MIETFQPGFAIIPFSLIILIVLIHINIAITLTRFAKGYREKHGRDLFFVHPMFLIPLSLLFGLVIGVLASFLVAIEKR